MKTIKRKIEILKELQNDYDTEIAHSSADDVLLDIIDYLLKKQPKVAKIIREEYEKVDKWYA